MHSCMMLRHKSTRTVTEQNISAGFSKCKSQVKNLGRGVLSV